MRKSGRRKTGFTLVEILITVIVLTSLMSLLLPAIQQAREAARATQCRNNLQQIGIALLSYHDVNSSLPPGCVNRTSPVPFGLRPEMGLNPADEFESAEVALLPAEAELLERQKLKSDVDWYRISWLAQILPQLDQRAMFRRIDFDDPRRSFLSPEELADFDQQLKDAAANPNFQTELPRPSGISMSVLRCSSSAGGVMSSYGVGLSHYAGCYDSRPVMIQEDNNGLLFLNSSVSFHNIPDGRSHTLLVGESGGIAMDSGFLTGDFSTLRSTFAEPKNSWRARSAKIETDEPAGFGFGTPHSMSINLLMADGAVVPSNLMADLNVFQQYGSRNDSVVKQAIDSGTGEIKANQRP